jgi:plastocyanin
MGLLCSLPAAEIRGTVVVKRKLTKRLAAPALNTYERGAAVPLAVSDDDPLVYERTHTVVFLEGELSPAPGMVKTMEQENRSFGPDMVVVPVGSSVSFPNLDPIFHNVFSLSKAKSFDLGNYPKGQTRSVTFNKPGVVLVNCRLHTNMSAVIVVTPNRFYASPDGEGRFTIKGVPAGKYSAVAWHKAAGFIRQEVTVTEGAPVEIEFLVPLSEEGGARVSSAAR